TGCSAKPARKLLDQEQRSAHIDRKVAIELLGRHLQQSGMGVMGVSHHQDFNPAENLGSIEKSVRGGQFAEVQLQKTGLPTEGGDGSDNLVRLSRFTAPGHSLICWPKTSDHHIVTGVSESE